MIMGLFDQLRPIISQRLELAKQIVFAMIDELDLTRDVVDD